MTQDTKEFWSKVERQTVSNFFKVDDEDTDSLREQVKKLIQLSDVYGVSEEVEPATDAILDLINQEKQRLLVEVSQGLRAQPNVDMASAYHVLVKLGKGLAEPLERKA